MIHPLTPREKAAAVVLDAAAAYLIQQYGASHGLDHEIDRARIMSAIPNDAILATLASGSGDHAELARLAEAATPGPWIDGPPAWFRGRRSEEDGKRPIQRPGHPGTMANVYGKENAAFIAAANPATVLALLAEIAALREQVKFEKQVAYDENDRWQEAERKLAEAVGLLEWARDELPEINPSNYDHDDACHLNAKSVEVTLAIISFLSKEAERDRV